MRSEKDPRDYIGLTIDNDDLPEHVDGYFVGYASHSTVLLAWDPKANAVRRVHHAIVDEFNIRTLEDEKLTPNSVLLQDMPPSVLDEHGIVDRNKMRIVTCNLKETKERVSASECATIAVTLPPKDTNLGIKFTSDETFGFPVLSRVEPTSPLRTQIPMDLQCNCWIIAINSQHNGHIEPISAKFCFDEIKRCQAQHDDVVIELTFHRKIKPVRTELQQL